MKNFNKEDIWEQFFNDPRLSRIIEEAEMVDSDQDSNMDGTDEEGKAPPQEKQEGESQGSTVDLEQLAADFQEGAIDQDDLIKLYQSGKISKEDVQQIISSVEGEEPQSEEELLAQQVDQTNDMFVKFALYDKIAELNEKLSYFKENFDDTRSDVYERTLQLGEFLNILSSLIFSIETPVSYQMYGSILLQLTELFNDYNQQETVEDAQKEKRDQQMDKENKEEDTDNPEQLTDIKDREEMIDHESGPKRYL